MSEQPDTFFQWYLQYRQMPHQSIKAIVSADIVDLTMLYFPWLLVDIDNVDYQSPLKTIILHLTPWELPL